MAFVLRDEFKTELENMESRLKLVERQLGQIKDIINSSTERTNSFMQLMNKTLEYMQTTEKNILQRIEGLELREEKFKIRDSLHP